MSKLSTSTCAPRVQVSISHYSYSMSLPACHLSDFLLLQDYNELWFRLVRAAILVLGHRRSIRVAKLTTATTSPRVETTFKSECHCVRISTSYLDYSHIDEKINYSRSGLVGIAFNICWKVFHRSKPKLSTSTSAPGVYIAFNIDSNSVAVAPCDLVYTLIPELVDFEWIWLEGISFAILGHNLYDFRGVT